MVVLGLYSVVIFFPTFHNLEFRVGCFRKCFADVRVGFSSPPGGRLSGECPEGSFSDIRPSCVESVLLSGWVRLPQYVLQPPRDECGPTWGPVQRLWYGLVGVVLIPTQASTQSTTPSSTPTFLPPPCETMWRSGEKFCIFMRPEVYVKMIIIDWLKQNPLNQLWS